MAAVLHAAALDKRPTPVRTYSTKCGSSGWGAGPSRTNARHTSSAQAETRESGEPGGVPQRSRADRKFDGMCHLLVGPAIERDALRTHRFSGRSPSVSGVWRCAPMTNHHSHRTRSQGHALLMQFGDGRLQGYECVAADCITPGDTRSDAILAQSTLWLPLAMVCTAPQAFASLGRPSNGSNVQKHPHIIVDVLSPNV